MALSAQQQQRHLYVAETANTASASSVINTDKEIVIASADGTAAAAGTDFKIVSQSGGEIIASPLIKADQVLYAKSVAYVAPTLGTATSAVPGAPVAGSLYTVSITINGFGSLSPEDEYIKKGFYQAATGDDQAAVVDGLVASLNRNFSREVGATANTNPYFTFSNGASGASSYLVVTEKVDWVNKYWKVGTKDSLTLPFSVNITVTTGEVIAVTHVSSKEGIGQGKQVASAEWYLKGERNDFYREAGYPHNFKNSYDADPSLKYNYIEIGYYKEGRDEAKKSKAQVTIAVETANLADNAETNKLITDLNTILGAGSVTALPVT